MTMNSLSIFREFPRRFPALVAFCAVTSCLSAAPSWSLAEETVFLVPPPVATPWPETRAVPARIDPVGPAVAVPIPASENQSAPLFTPMTPIPSGTTVYPRRITEAVEAPRAIEAMQAVEAPETSTGSKTPQPLKPPTAEEITEALRQFGDRSPVSREAALRRLLPHPQAAAEATVRVFRSGGLSTRLTALELLREWKAPADGLDPWQPETLTDERLDALDRWQKEVVESAAAPFVPELTESQRAELAGEIARMLRVSDAEAEAVRERLARRGAALLPEVYEQLKIVTRDGDRLRLQALRYRLVAGETLSARWPDGLLRLASPDTATRQKSAEELVTLAKAEDQGLLRELFSDPNPLVREISLRGMQKIGGETQALLLDLLADPNPNVRAAVLKQLEENPGPGTSAKITEYVKTEKDADLVGHAVRVLKTLRGQRDTRATRSLIELLKHDSWQVRAEAATALGSDTRHFSSYDNQRLSPAEQLQVDVYVALIELLVDEDSFVVSKAVEGLEDVDMPAAVEPFIQVIRRHPDLARHVVDILIEGDKMQAKALPLLHELCRDANPLVRAAVIERLPDLAEGEIVAAMEDADSRVRIAATRGLLRHFDSLRTAALSRFSSVEISGVRRSSTFSRLFQALTTRSGKPVEVTVESVDEIAPAVILETVEIQQHEDDPFTDMPDDDAVEAAVVEKDADPEDTENAGKVADTVEIENDTEFEGTEADKVLQRALNEKSSTISSDAYDRWLADFSQGKERPDWAEALLPRIETMLSAESSEERLAAAVVLVPLGQADKVLPLLLETARDKPEFFDSFVAVVPWLAREKRWELFRQWRSSNKPDEGQISEFIERAVEPVDLRNEGPLWELLAEKDSSNERFHDVFRSLKPLYLTRRFTYSHETPPSKDVREAVIAKLLERIDSGTEAQRLVALALLLPVDVDKTREIAERFDGDPFFSDEFRRDMFQIRLLTQKDDKAGMEFAVETLKQKDPTRSKLALNALVREPYRLRILRGNLYLDLPTSYRSGSGRKDVRQLPQGLELDAVKPLIDDENEEIAAYAGYFTALLGDASGMDVLLKYRRKIQESPDGDGDWLDVLATRAVAALDDPRYVPLLREMYEKMDNSNVTDFYWTIRGMTGPEILKLRKEIRDKHGMRPLM